MRLILFSLLLVRICQAQDMVQADRAFVQAITQADKPALSKLLDADFTWTNADGQTLTRAQVLENLPKPAMPNASAAELKTYHYGALGDVQANLDRAHVLRV